MKIDWIELKQQSKKHIGYNLLVLLCGILTLVFFVLAVGAIFLTQKSEEIVIKEVFDVSSAPLDATNQNFVSQLSGCLMNYQDEAAKVESIIVVVGNGREREKIELDSITLHPRLAEEIRHEWKTSLAFDRVHSVTVVVDGKEQMLSNSTATWDFNPNIVLYAILCALFCFGTVFAFKKRYYRYQEDLIAARVEETREEE